MAVFISLILSDKPIGALIRFSRPFRVRARIREFHAEKSSGLSEIDVHLGGRGRTLSLTGNVTPLHRANVNGRYSLTSSYLLFPKLTPPYTAENRINLTLCAPFYGFARRVIKDNIARTRGNVLHLCMRISRV